MIFSFKRYTGEKKVGQPGASGVKVHPLPQRGNIFVGLQVKFVSRPSGPVSI